MCTLFELRMEWIVVFLNIDVQLESDKHFSFIDVTTPRDWYSSRVL
jgi:hypothetical protein